MPHDPARVEDTRGWLARADDDLKAAGHLLKPSPPHLRSALFHCQQAAEKALKAFLAWHDVPFSKTHDIEQIGEACIALDASLRRSVDRAVPLTEYAWKFRYPGEALVPARKEGTEALRIARELYETILSRLPKEVKP